MEPLNRLESILEKQYKNKRHLTSAANDVFMAAYRTGIDLNRLLDLIESGDAFDLEDFTHAYKGNVFNFVCEEIQKHLGISLTSPLVEMVAWHLSDVESSLLPSLQISL